MKGPTMLALENLPAVLRLRCLGRAVEAQRLSPLPTTSLHGALGHTLRAQLCEERDRSECPGCPRIATCAYPRLFDPPGAGVHGAAQSAPPAVVLDFPDYVPDEEPRELGVGAELRFDVTIVGPRAGDGVAVEAAIARALERGLGVGDREDGVRPRLTLESAEHQLVTRTAVTEGASRLTLELRTPLRLVVEGREQLSLDAELLFRAMLRRADLLARVHGGGPLVERLAEVAVPFRVAESSVRVARVQRWSGRQGQRMSWAGLVGAARLEGESLGMWRPLFSFLEAVHLGKGASFGLGAIRVRG